MAKIYIALNDILIERQISKRTICIKCHMQAAQLNRYCNSTVLRIDLRTLSSLCDFLQCTPNDILKLKHDNQQAPPDVLF